MRASKAELLVHGVHILSNACPFWLSMLPCVMLCTSRAPVGKSDRAPSSVRFCFP